MSDEPKTETPKPRKLDTDDFVRMNLPREFWSASSKLIQPDPYPVIFAFGKNINENIRDGLGFVLMGPAGVGKTGIAAVLAKIAKSYGHTVLFVSISDLRELTRSRIDFDAQSSMADRAREVDLLVLDNLRSEDAKEAIVNAASLEGLLEHRTAWKRSTIITTRLKPADLSKDFPGLLERIRGRCVLFPVIGKDLRTDDEAQVKARLGVLKK